MSNKIKHGEMLRLWGIQESLLQQYRSMFMSSQSILFSFGTSLALATDKFNSAIIGVILLFILSVYLLRIWLTVTSERAEGVNFCQNEIIKMENNNIYTQNPLNRLNEHLTTNKPIIKWKHLIFSSKELFGHKQHTRKKMQNLPTIFFWLWIFLIVLSLFQIIS